MYICSYVCMYVRTYLYVRVHVLAHSLLAEFIFFRSVLYQLRPLYPEMSLCFLLYRQGFRISRYEVCP